MAELQQSAKSRIFVVDDEDGIASTTAAILCLKGYAASAFTQPLEALSASRLQSPDLLISDVAMPVLSGVELAIQLLQGCPDCKVLLFSGQWDPSDLLDVARENGHNFEMIPKPVHLKDLVKKVQEMTLHPVLAVSADEARARNTLAENMRQALAAVRADVAVSVARKKPGKSRAARNSGG